MTNKPNTVCRVCGKEYYCCADSKAIGSWRVMACSEEHYKEYMRRIEESRKKNKIKIIEEEAKEIKEVKEETSETISVETVETTERPKRNKKRFGSAINTETITENDEN